MCGKVSWRGRVCRHGCAEETGRDYLDCSVEMYKCLPGDDSAGAVARKRPVGII